MAEHLPGAGQAIHKLIHTQSTGNRYTMRQRYQ